MAGMDSHHVAAGDMMADHHHQLIEGSMNVPEQQHHHVQDHDDMTVNHSNHQVQLNNWGQPVVAENNEGLKRILLDLQRHWLSDFQKQRERLLVEVTEKLHEEFLADEEKTRAELCQQFKEELDTTKDELDKKYRDSLRLELEQLDERHKKELNTVKRQQWCWQCEKEAIYPCCWNTAYCGVECQQAHWPHHKKYCRRKKSGAK